MVHERGWLRKFGVGHFHRHEVHSATVIFGEAISSPLNRSFNLSVERVIFGHFYVESGHPFRSTLSQQNFIGEHLSSVAPLFDSQTTTRRILLIIRGTAHNFGGKTCLTDLPEHTHIVYLT